MIRFSSSHCKCVPFTESVSFHQVLSLIKLPSFIRIFRCIKYKTVLFHQCKCSSKQNRTFSMGNILTTSISSSMLNGNDLTMCVCAEIKLMIFNLTVSSTQYNTHPKTYSKTYNSAGIIIY